MPERLRPALDAGWRGEMPRAMWIVRDGAREARSGLLTADVLDGGLQRVTR
ncbi:putative signal peptide protein [Burkholderia cepacia]